MLQQWHVSCPFCHVLGPFLQGLQQADVLRSLKVPKASRDQFKAHSTTSADCSREIKTCLLLGRKVMTNLDSLLKSRDITLPTKVRLVKAMFFSSSHVWMWELNYKESWAPKNWCFWTVVLEKTLESPLDIKEIQPVHPEGKQSFNVHWKDWCWSWSSNTLATWYKELTHLKRPWCWERLKVRGEGDDNNIII